MKAHGYTLQNCDFIKLVLMIMVVLEHSIAVSNDNWFNLDIQKDSLLHWISWTLDQFHIYAFVIISGYIFRYLLIEKNHYPDFRGFAWKKAQRLIIPLVFVSIVWTLPINSVYFGSKIKESLWLLIEGPSQLWFLYMLFGVYMVAWMISNLMENKTILLGLIMVICYFVGVVGMQYLPNPFQIWRVLMFLPFFYVGFLLRKMDAKKISETLDVKTRIMLVGGGILGLLVLLLIRHFVDGRIASLLSIMTLFCVRFVLSILAFCGIDMLANKVRWKDSKVISYGISMSMIVYMFHNQFVFVIIHCLYKFINLYSLITICFICSILMSCLLGTVFKKFKVTRYLIGEKV